MQAGKLRNLVDIEQRATTTDSFGGQTNTWSAFASSIPVDIQPLSGQEAVRAASMSTGVTHRVILRYLAGVLPGMRVNFGGRFFDIQVVLNDGERNRSLRLYAMEGLSDG
jgi:SPP1 family predicted phage head-tail adaptor